MADGVAPVSVVIAAYQAERTLGAALASALGQVPRPAEVIVVDDGSRDGTSAVARSYPGVRVIEQPNQGPSAARNTGIREATQPWVAFLDADDVWLAGKLARQRSAQARHPDAVLLAGDREPAGGARRRAPEPAGGRPRETRLGYRDLLLLNRFQTSTVQVRTEALSRCGGFDPTVDGAEDWDLWLRCARLGPVVKLDVPLVMYREEPAGHGGNLGRLYSRMLLMLDRERVETSLTATAFAQVLTWHYLRFALAFLVAGQSADARRTWRELRVAGLVGHVPAAAVRHLAPFLAGRMVRRLRGV
ncbi:hypothetical protein GCM10009665_67320 [Kitasatospora nipponensis]|uniref:Glycosyltransferase 2-like domain-containing protein n=1 Tax=Kitasatospora nipponensis TaxID=258049 RepID=A0ABP4HP73_9ACTN